MKMNTLSLYYFIKECFGNYFSNIVWACWETIVTRARPSPMLFTLLWSSGRVIVSIFSFKSFCWNMKRWFYAIMKELSTVKCAAKMRKFTSFAPKIHTITRCTSMYDMFCRYFYLRDFLLKLEREDVDDSILSALTNWKIHQLMESWKFSIQFLLQFKPVRSKTFKNKY